VDSDALDRCQETLQYQFNDPGLLELALTHASVAPSRTESNERLEFLGDSVLGLVVCHRLYESEDDLLEGEMTKVKSSVVSRSTCAKVAKSTGLCEYVCLGKGMGSSGTMPMSVAAALLESLIGAIYVDGGLDNARDFILRHMGEHIDAALDNQHGLNYKSRLQQTAQQQWNVTPQYMLLDEKGPDHSKCFEVAVSIDGRHFPSAWGKTKKEAEQKAAMSALEELGLAAAVEPEATPNAVD
jgi:ribonuclease-3